MQLPKESSHYGVVVAYGRYVTARLSKDKLKDLSGSVKKATDGVKKAGRAWDDRLEAMQEYQALRDAVDEELDTAAQDLRLKLASVSLDAVSKPPYTQVFPKGVSYYTAAPLGEVPQRLGELVQRVEAHLPDKDPSRVAVVKAVKAGLEDFVRAVDGLKEARTSRTMARTALEEAMDDWSVLLEKTYGTLVAQYGRKKANAFFPGIGRRSAAADGSEEAETPVETPAP